MRNNVDANDKIVDIRLSLRSDVGSKMVWILVEGEDDCRIYPHFFDDAKTKVEFVNGGKGQLLIALNTLSAETEQVIGIQDADFLHLEKSDPMVKNLFYTDCHDVEIMMLKFDNVIRSLFSEYLMNEKREDIWQNVLQEASHVAYIRWYNEKNNCKIRFNGLKYGDNLTKIVDGKLSIKNHDLLQILNERSPQ